MNAMLEQRLKKEHSIPIDQLIAACSILPWNYNYEIPKTIDKMLTCKKAQSKQMRERSCGVMKVSL